MFSKPDSDHGGRYILAHGVESELTNLTNQVSAQNWEDTREVQYPKDLYNMYHLMRASLLERFWRSMSRATTRQLPLSCPKKDHSTERLRSDTFSRVSRMGVCPLPNNAHALSGSLGSGQVLWTKAATYKRRQEKGCRIQAAASLNPCATTRL